MRKRILIIAGTHERENEFSHSVADRLIAIQGEKEPDYTFEGIDGACRGKLWIYSRIAVAKIDKIGETSKEYLETLSQRRLLSLAKFRFEHEGLEFPPSIDSCFGGANQCTSVSQQLIDAAEAEMYTEIL